MRKIQTKAGDIKWTKVALSYLQERYTKTQLRHIARKLGVPAYTVRRKLLELGLQEPNNPFSPKEVQFILDNYQKYSYREIATELGKTFKQVRNQSILLGIKKTEKVHPHHLRIPYKTKKYVLDNYYAKTYKQIATELGIALQSVCRIVRLLKQEGKITKSKGKWTPPKGGKTFYINKTPTKTSFKKGQKPHNYRAIGSERLTSNGYTEVKIADPEVWDRKQNIIYKQHHGEIPAKHIIIFKDKNKQNFAIENLECISRAEQARRNNNPQKTGATNKKHYQKVKTAILLGKELTTDIPFAKRYMPNN